MTQSSRRKANAHHQSVLKLTGLQRLIINTQKEEGGHAISPCSAEPKVVSLCVCADSAHFVQWGSRSLTFQASPRWHYETMQLDLPHLYQGALRNRQVDRPSGPIHTSPHWYDSGRQEQGSSACADSNNHACLNPYSVRPLSQKAVHNTMEGYLSSDCGRCGPMLGTSLRTWWCYCTSCGKVTHKMPQAIVRRHS